jgi:hypothetical protein
MYYADDEELSKIQTVMQERQETYRRRVNSGDAVNKWITAMRTSATLRNTRPRSSTIDQKIQMDTAIKRCKHSTALMRVGILDNTGAKKHGQTELTAHEIASAAGWKAYYAQERKFDKVAADKLPNPPPAYGNDTDTIQ